MAQIFLIKMPAACFLMVAYSFFYYKKAKRFNTAVSRTFERLVYCVLLCLVSDAVTEYTVNHRETVPEQFNYFWHIVFLLAVLSTCFLMYFYTVTYIECTTGVRKLREKNVTQLVWAAFIAAILFLPIEYIDTKYGSYSLGPKAYALYAGVVYTIVLSLYNLIRYWKRLDRVRREAVLLSILIFIAFSLLQMALPYILTTGLAMAMIVMGLLLTTEDFNQYLDEKQEFFNEQACRALLRERIYRRKEFTVPVYVFIGQGRQVGEVMRSACAKMAEDFHLTGTMIGRNMLAFLPDGRGWLSKAKHVSSLPVLAGDFGQVQEFSFLLHGDGDSDVEALLEEMHHFKRKHEEKVLYVDAMSGVFNRNAYERDIGKELAEEKSMWYFLIDLNHLKKVNDTLGHSAGDELIKGAAAVLKEGFGKEGRVYRIGGDEFAVLYKGKDAGRMVEQLEQVRQRRNAASKIPLSYAVGYAFYEPGVSEWSEVVRHADFDMYRDKLRDGTRG